MKQCSHCKELKPLLKYDKRVSSEDGFNHECRRCYQLQYREKNKEKLKKRQQFFYRRDREDILEKSRKDRKDNPEKYRQAYIKNIDKEREKTKNWKRRNPDLVKAQKNKPCQRLRKNISRRIKGLLSRPESTSKLLGCSGQFLKDYLEARFTEGMTWENYGLYGWHMDHIRPIASFDLNNEAEVKECFHYTNLQPLWAKDNLSKGAKFENRV